MSRFIKIASCFLFVVFFVCNCHGSDGDVIDFTWEFPARPRPPATFTQDKTKLSCGPIQSVVEELVSFIRTNRTGELLPLFLHPSLESWNRLFRWGRQSTITVVDTMANIKEVILESLGTSGTIIQTNNAYFFLTVLFDLALSQIYAGKWGTPLPRYTQNPLGPICSSGYPRPLFVNLVSSFRDYGLLSFLKKTFSEGRGESGHQEAYFFNLRLLYDRAVKKDSPTPSLIEGIDFGDADCRRRVMLCYVMLSAQLLLTTDFFWHDANRVLQYG